ncbi:MAG TPA: DUF4399 domain-containing protein [Xanthobacteraceae bacterium]|nr:DUF4399 domain-containing protein [Xanthobacteraceae bacterium]
MKRIVLSAFVALTVLAFLVACGASEAPAGSGRTQTLTILSPKDGDTLNNPITIKMAVTGVNLVPAQTPAAAGQGHLHLLIDTDIPPGGAVIPSAANYIHLGNGAAEATLPALSPGPHRITAVFADSNHKVTNPILAYSVNIIVPGPTAVPPKPGTKYP